MRDPGLFTVCLLILETVTDNFSTEDLLLDAQTPQKGKVFLLSVML